MPDRSSRPPFAIPPGSSPDRLDRWLARAAAISRGEARRIIEAGGAFVDGRRCRIASKELGPGAELSWSVRAPALAAKADAAAAASAATGNEPRFIFRDAQLAVVWKPPGMPVEPTRDSSRGTLLDWVRSQPGVSYVAAHHRLDRDAEGLLVLALARRANAGLAAAFRERTAHREYRVLVEGRPAPEGDGGSPAGEWRHLQVSRAGRRVALPWREGEPHGGGAEEMRATWRFAGTAACAPDGSPRSLLLVSLQTGRTHQIRLQAAAEGMPVVGDRLYGLPSRGSARAPSREPLGLQAAVLDLPHPVTGGPLHFEIPEPPWYKAAPSGAATSARALGDDLE
jgi:23S rRNA pseudouridine1911/1915/1917 synthase